MLQGASNKFQNPEKKLYLILGSPVKSSTNTRTLQKKSYQGPGKVRISSFARKSKFRAPGFSLHPTTGAPDLLTVNEINRNLCLTCQLRDTFVQKFTSLSSRYLNQTPVYSYKDLTKASLVVLKHYGLRPGLRATGNTLFSSIQIFLI